MGAQDLAERMNSAEPNTDLSIAGTVRTRILDAFVLLGMRYYFADDRGSATSRQAGCLL